MRKEELIRSTSYGKVRGTCQGETAVWYGIPYGKAPAGALRWQAPREPDSWDGVYDAAQPAEQAMQLGPGGIYGTEDCLKLDIYSSGTAEKRPVLVFLHGGNNQNGTTEELSGIELVQKDEIIFVSVGYRLGLLGFNPLPAIACTPFLKAEAEDAGKDAALMQEEERTGSFALLDLAAALDWIRENIEAFGGDPENITVSGFSAGGRNVMAMLISPLFAGKFEKAIAFSGGMTSADLPWSREIIAEYLVPFVLRDGKAENPGAAKRWLQEDCEEVRQYLYSLSSEELCSLAGGAAIRMKVFPHLFADGTVLPENKFDTGKYNSVPLMMVSGTTEFSCFVLGDAYFEQEELRGLSEQELTAAKAFAIRWGSAMYRCFNTDASAQRMAAHYEAPMYLCNINYGNTDSGHPIEPLGSFHGIVLPMLWSQAECTSNAPAGTYSHPAYVAMAEQFHKYLKQFLYTGDPNGSRQDREQGGKNSQTKPAIAWPGWDAKERLSLILDGAGDEAAVCRKACEASFEAILNEMEADHSVSDEIKQKLIRRVMNGRWFSEALDARYREME